MNSFLGNFWHLLNPALQIGVYFLIFGLVLDTTRGVDNFMAFLAIGVFTFSLTQRSVIAGSQTLRKHLGLIQIINFPRALLPITATLTETLSMLPAYVVMLGVATVTGEMPRIAWLLLLPLLVSQSILNAAFALVAARAASHVPDVQNILPFIFRLGFYASGVIFNVNAYVEQSRFRLAFELNPIYAFLELTRAAVLHQYPFEPRLLLIAAAWVIIVPILALVWFRAAEDSYGAA